MQLMDEGSKGSPLIRFAAVERRATPPGDIRMVEGVNGFENLKKGRGEGISRVLGHELTQLTQYSSPGDLVSRRGLNSN